MRLDFEVGSNIQPNQLADVPSFAWSVLITNRSDGIISSTDTPIGPLFTEKDEASEELSARYQEVLAEAEAKGDYWFEYDSPELTIREIELGAREVIMHVGGVANRQSLTVVQVDKT